MASIWQQKEVIGDATLYLGDCLDILPTLDKVDAVIADPPYEEEAHTQQRRLLGKQESKVRGIRVEPLEFPPITERERLAISEQMAQVSNGWILVFCQAEAVSLWRDSLKLGGAKYRRACVWIKPDGQPQISGDRPGMGYESIVAAWAAEGRSTWNGGGKCGVFTHAQRDNNSPKLQQAQKPIKLMNELVHLFTQKEQIILDPYCGSATTGVAALSQGRKFIGIEKNLQRFLAACERIENAQRQGRLFE